MASRVPLLVFRLAILVAIAVSSALLIDYFRPLPAFCDVGSGCDKVRASGYGKFLGAPVPLLGLLAFVSLMFLSLVRNDSVERIVGGLALLGGATGIGLLLVQAFGVKAFCKLCVVVDTAAIVAAIAAWLSLRSPRGPPAARWLWPAATFLALLLPSGWAILQPSPPVPPEIASLWVPGKINVVEFADFQCPFCRQLHPRMVEVLREYDDRVHFVRLNVPLASHSNAQTAARAYCCAGEQGKGDAMADALFASDQLSPEACERLAASLGVSLAEFRVCVENPATDARINDEARRARSAGLAGLPTVWVGDRFLVGLQPIESLREAFAEAARGGSTRLPTALLWAALVAALAVIGTLAIRARPATTGADRPL